MSRRPIDRIVADWSASNQERAATLLAAEVLILASGLARVAARAVGDTFLFHRERRRTRVFPRWTGHSSTPDLLRTAPTSGPARVVRYGRTALPGSTLWFATDEMANWIVRELQAYRRPWAVLGELASDDDFATWVGAMRRSGAVDDDERLRCAGRRLRKGLTLESMIVR